MAPREEESRKMDNKVLLSTWLMTLLATDMVCLKPTISREGDRDYPMSWVLSIARHMAKVAQKKAKKMEFNGP